MLNGDQALTSDEYKQLEERRGLFRDTEKEEHKGQTVYQAGEENGVPMAPPCPALLYGANFLTFCDPEFYSINQTMRCLEMLKLLKINQKFNIEMGDRKVSENELNGVLFYC